MGNDPYDAVLDDLAITIEFVYEYEDLVPTPPTPWKRKGSTILRWLFSGLFVVGLAFVLDIDRWKSQTGAERFSEINMWIIVVVLLLAWQMIHFSRRRRRWRRRRLQNYAGMLSNFRYSATISFKGVFWQCNGWHRAEPWTYYWNHIETPNGFYLCTIAYSMVLIPKRVLSIDQEEIVRELLRRHASQATGFPIDVKLKAPVMELMPPRDSSL